MSDSDIKLNFCPSCATSLRLDLKAIGKKTRFYCPRCHCMLAKSSRKNLLRILSVLILVSGLFAVYTRAVDLSDLPRLASGGLVAAFSLSVFIYSLIVPEVRKESNHHKEGFEYVRYKELQLRQEELMEANS